MNDLIAVITPLDTINLVVKLVGVFGNIRKILQTAVNHVGGSCQGVFCSRHIGHVLDNRPLFEEFIGDRLHGRHPVAKEDVRVPHSEGIIGDRHREGDLGGIIADGVENVDPNSVLMVTPVQLTLAKRT